MTDEELDAELEARCAVYEAERKRMVESDRRTRIVNWICLVILAVFVAASLWQLGFLRWRR